MGALLEAPCGRRAACHRQSFPEVGDLSGVRRALPGGRGGKGLNAMTDAANGLLCQTADWDFATLQRIHDACEKVALGELGLDVYPNQIEIITAEQMLDAYSSAGMPLYYRHWSFGKHFASQEAFYRKGLMMSFPTWPSTYSRTPSSIPSRNPRPIRAFN